MSAHCVVMHHSPAREAEGLSSWDAGFVEVDQGGPMVFHFVEFPSRREAEGWLERITSVDHSGRWQEVRSACGCGWLLDELPDRQTQEHVIEIIEEGGMEAIQLDGFDNPRAGSAET